MNLINLEESFRYKNETYHYLNPVDIKKLPITEELKQKLISYYRALPIDRNTLKVLSEVIRYIKINRKKFPEQKNNIEIYYKGILDNFFDFNIGPSEACNMCRDFEPNKKAGIFTQAFEEEIELFNQ